MDWSKNCEGFSPIALQRFSTAEIFRPDLWKLSERKRNLWDIFGYSVTK